MQMECKQYTRKQCNTGKKKHAIHIRLTTGGEEEQITHIKLTKEKKTN